MRKTWGKDCHKWVVEASSDLHPNGDLLNSSSVSATSRYFKILQVSSGHPHFSIILQIKIHDSMDFPIDAGPVGGKITFGRAARSA